MAPGHIWEEVLVQGGPEARSSHAVAVVDNVAYVFGGEQKPRVPIDSDLYALDLATKRWSIAEAGGSPPPPRVGVTMVSVEKRIYVFGGRDEKSNELDDLYAYDTVSKTWTHILTEGGPVGRSYHAAADDSKGLLYIFGGCSAQGRCNDLFAFDTRSEKWQALPSAPAACLPRGGPGLAIVNNKVYVVFGFSGEEQSDIWAFDLKLRTWEELQCKGELPCARSVFGTAVVDDHIIIYGGEVDPSDKGHEGAGAFSSEVFALNTVTLQWKKLDVAVQGGKAGPGARGWFAAGAFGNSILIYGGNSATNERLNDLHMLTIEQ